MRFAIRYIQCAPHRPLRYEEEATPNVGRVF
jgi:hypothetical protein